MYVKHMKTITTREFFHSPATVKTLRPGQSLAVTDNGKPSFTIIKAGRRPRLTQADLDRRAVRIASHKGEVNLVEGIIELRRQGR